QRRRTARSRASDGVRAVLPRIDRVAFGVGSGSGAGGPAGPPARWDGIAARQPDGRSPVTAAPARPQLTLSVLRSLAPRREPGPLRGFLVDEPDLGGACVLRGIVGR